MEGKLILLSIIVLMIVGTVAFAFIYDGLFCPKCRKRMKRSGNDQRTGSEIWTCPRCGYRIEIQDPDYDED